MPSLTVGTLLKVISDIVRELLQFTLIVFVVLKIVGRINWSWWWVLAPLWIPLAIVVVVLTAVGIWASRLDVKDKE